MRQTIGKHHGPARHGGRHPARRGPARNRSATGTPVPVRRHAAGLRPWIPPMGLPAGFGLPWW